MLCARFFPPASEATSVPGGSRRVSCSCHRVAATFAEKKKEGAAQQREVEVFLSPRRTDAGAFLKAFVEPSACLRSSLRLTNASPSVHERSPGSHASHSHSERYYFHQNLRRRAALPHERCLAPKILRGLRGHRRGCGYNRQADREIQRIRLCEYKQSHRSLSQLF